MKYGPNFGKMREVLFTYHRGLLTVEEMTRWVNWLMDPQHHIPVAEDCGKAYGQDQCHNYSTELRRIERKLDAIISLLQLQLPDDINPMVVDEEVKQFLRENQRGTAIEVLRTRTGIDYVEAKMIIDDYIAKHGVK